MLPRLEAILSASFLNRSSILGRSSGAAFSALPETWLVHLVRLADEDPETILVRLAKEEEGVGISAGAYFAGVKSAMLMQNHGFLASINGIVSFAHLYKIPLLMLISYRGALGERDPWQTEGGNVRSVESFKAAVTGAVHGSELTTIIAKVEAIGPSGYVTDLSLLENRFQFRRHIQSLKTH